MKRILLTGASGFIGQKFIHNTSDKYKIVTASLKSTLVENIDFSAIDVIIHMAGIAHQMNDIDPKIYYDVNFNLTKELALKSMSGGVKQFVFISTVKVFGLLESDYLNDQTIYNSKNDPYAESKLLAERSISELNSTDFVVSIVRPPLVYGAGVKGNLERLMRLISKFPILPFGNIMNKRSMVYVGNLTSLIERIIEKRASGIFIAGDNRPHSTSELVETIITHFGKSNTLFQLPKIMISLLFRIRPALADRLFASLVFDNSETNRTLNFNPPFSFDQGIKEMVHAYKNSRN